MHRDQTPELPAAVLFLSPCAIASLWDSVDKKVRNSPRLVTLQFALCTHRKKMKPINFKARNAAPPTPRDPCPSDWKKFLSLLCWPADIITAVCSFTLTSLPVSFQIAFSVKQWNSRCGEKNKKYRLFSRDKYPIKQRFSAWQTSK